jgi:integrase
MGINMKVVQELLGHSDIAITLGLYSHLLPSMQKEVTDKWDDAFGYEEDEERSDEEEEE